MSATTTRTDILPVVIGGDIGAYALARECNEALGVKPILINTGFIGAISHSKILTTYTVKALDDIYLLEALTSLSANAAEKTILLIANTDQLIELLERVYDQLPANVVCPIPSLDAFNSVCDKATFSQLCKAHGLEVPQTEVVHLAGTDAIKPTALSFPVIAKPAESASYYSTLIKGFKKVYNINNQSELDTLWSNLRASGFAGDFLVQQLIGGDDTYMDSITIYMDADGNARMLGAAQVILEDHAPAMLGNPVAMVIREKPELWAKVERMLQSIGYYGFANFDVKRDPVDGKEYFLDCNPRIGRNSYYNCAGGVNPMQVLINEAIDGNSEDVQIANKPALYTLVPLSLMRKYIRDPKLMDEVNRLISTNNVVNPQHNPADKGAKRLLDVVLTEGNQIRKFAKYYPEATDTSF
ncbi:carboxylate--amine ligase [Atopobium fossor]|uniref:carboxylate--amine ligase n=1 Tax=Atopobium fossor TaxID=39487 RepID=UPI0003FF06C8|nr:hypothetical protein [Atopobium fossor]